METDRLSPDNIPLIPRGVRLHHDTVRGLWVLLAPERTINLDPIGLAILQEIDGTSSLQGIVDRLAQAYAAPSEEIFNDVRGFVLGLMDRRILEVQP